MIPIASLDDERVAEYRLVTTPAALARAGLFVAEGRFVVARLLAGRRHHVRSLLVTPTAIAALHREGIETGAVPVWVAEPPVMNAIVGFDIHRGCLALAERPRALSFARSSLTHAARLLVLEGVNNPDNVGGLFRSAAAFGADGVVLGPGCGDPLYRKAIRTSMAATLQVPYAVADDWPGTLTAMRDAGVRVLALTPSQSATPLDDLGAAGPRVALLLGAEGEGLSDAAVAAADESVRIPIAAAVDSLNVTVAGSIAMQRLFVR